MCYNFCLYPTGFIPALKNASHLIREEYNAFRERDIDIQSIDVEAEKVNSERLKLKSYKEE